MTDLVPIQEAPSALMRFAQEASEVHGIAKALATTSFVPKPMQGRPDEITGAILMGAELDLPPMTALAVINVIEGKPSVSALGQRGMAMSKGVVFETISATDTRVQMRAKGPGQDAWTEVDWPIERARKMGLAEKANWKKMPQAMLIARATSELCRLVAANILIGLPYSTEELTDGIDEQQPVKPKMALRTVQRAAAMQHAEPELEPEGRIIGRGVAGDEAIMTARTTGSGYGEPVRELAAGPIPEQREVPEPDLGPPPDLSDKLTDTSRKAIMAAFNEMGVKDRAERLSNVSLIVGREIPSVNVLTEGEARRVIRKLQDARMEQHGGEKASDYDWPEVAGANA
jgi:hypothetical protein